MLRREANAIFCSRVGPDDGRGESVAREMRTVEGSMTWDVGRCWFVLLSLRLRLVLWVEM